PEPADPWIPEPREDQLAGHAGRDHLVIDEVRREPGEREVALPLADDLVAGGERDQVGEALDRDRVAVADELGDRVSHRRHLGSGHWRPIAGSIADAGSADAGSQLSQSIERDRRPAALRARLVSDRSRIAAIFKHAGG